MAFFQDSPLLGHQFDDDRVLRSFLARALDEPTHREIVPSIRAMGDLASGELYQLQVADRLNEPKLVSWDPWGKRIDQIEVSPLWKRAARVAAESGLIGTAYERRHGALSRVHQFALVYLFAPSSDVYTCPLAMTDGAAKTLLSHRSADHPNVATFDAAIAHLASRDPSQAWTSGQWMTEKTGGSDVSTTQTIATKTAEGWRLSGTKWFSSATTAEMALTLARPEGNPSGSRGLALFYLETRRADGSLNHITVNRLKDKLGTRKVPTAELTLEGTLAIPVTGLADGVKNITPMLTITRTWNSICAVAGMRRAIALVRDYGKRRAAFGALLENKPLHLDTLAGMQAEFEGAFHLAFRLVELLGREEAGQLSSSEAELLRLLTPIVKLTTGKQAVSVASEAIEAFGGAGYVEDTGLPMLLRDAQVLPIWEGTTNVLSLDTLRAVAKGDGMGAFEHEVFSLLNDVRDDGLRTAAAAAKAALSHASSWLVEHATQLVEVEASARRFALTLGRTLELALLVRHAQWSLDHERDGRAAAAARRLARHGVDLLVDTSIVDDSALLARDSV